MIKLIARIALAAGFIFPILDRLGVMGPAGSAGVSWGNWDAFALYTNKLIPFVSFKVASFFGVIATVTEALLAIGLLSGYKVKWMALGTAAITALFAIFMIFSLGPLAPISYPVYIFIAFGLLLWKVADEGGKIASK